MKRLLLLSLAFVLLCFPADLYARGASACAGAGGAAAACTTPTGSILSEGFNSTPDNTWVKPITQEGHTVTYGTDLPAGDPTGSCAKGVRIVVTSTANRERIYWDRGSALDSSAGSFDVEFSILFNSFNIATNDELYLAIWSADTEGGSYPFRLILKNDAGTYKIYSATSTKSTVVINTWYVVKLHADTTTTNSYIQVTGGGLTACDTASECTFTSGDVDGRYMVFGKGGYDTDYADFYIGYVKINVP